MTRSNKRSSIGLWVAYLAILLFILVPIIWTFVLSIRSSNALYSTRFSFSLQNLTLYRYVALLIGVPNGTEGLSSIWSGWETETLDAYRNGFLNSVIVGVGVTAICLVLGALAAFSFAKLRWRGNRWTFNFIIFLRFMPVTILIVPFFLMFRSVGLINTKLCLIIAYSALTLPLIVWILRAFYESVPDELIDSARVDGCTNLGIIVRILIPLSLPAFMTSGLIAFIQSWQEFLLALVLTSSNSAKTLPVAMAQFYTQEGINIGMLATGTVIALVPLVVIAFIAQKYIVRGLLAGAVVA